jgi:lysophospholipase L1-like esterase
MKHSGAVLILALLVFVAGAVPAQAKETSAPYLALGDSVAFGYNPTLDFSKASNFVGYPEEVAKKLHLADTNASCPGETSGSLIIRFLPDNGCGLYRSAFPLHVSYSGAQLIFALAFLHAHPSTKLVTLTVGANDVFLLQHTCASLSSSACFNNNLRAVITQAAANVLWILGQIRQGGYTGKIVVLTYYARNYLDSTEVLVIRALDAYTASVANVFGAVVADGFAAFREQAMEHGGSSCKAGLLIVTSKKPLTCDDHPSPAGRHLLAEDSDSD